MNRGDSCDASSSALLCSLIAIGCYFANEEAHLLAEHIHRFNRASLVTVSRLPAFLALDQTNVTDSAIRSLLSLGMCDIQSCRCEHRLILMPCRFPARARADIQTIQACLLVEVYGKLMSSVENHETVSLCWQRYMRIGPILIASGHTRPIFSILPS